MNLNNIQLGKKRASSKIMGGNGILLMRLKTINIKYINFGNMHR